MSITNMTPTVNVLISTYNGERYIREQIDSVLRQTYENVVIYVRDDGSTDKTIDILKNYEENHNIILSLGNNIGYGKSFLSLLQQADKGDYWAFCDQDDVWEDDKLEHALQCMRGTNDSGPVLYVHDYWLTDENLNPVEVYHNKVKGFDFGMSITQCVHMGFSTVFNSGFRELMLKGNIDNIPTHDWWAELIAMEFATVYEDDYIGAWHRRLDNSVSGMDIVNRIKWLGRALKGNSEILSITGEFERVFADDMDINDLNILRLFVSEKYSLIKAIKKAFYSKRWRTSLSSECVVRLLMLVGKI